MSIKYKIVCYVLHGRVYSDRRTHANQRLRVRYLGDCTLYVSAIFFCFSWSTIFWISASEIYPITIRGVCMAITAATQRVFLQRIWLKVLDMEHIYSLVAGWSLWPFGHTCFSEKLKE